MASGHWHTGCLFHSLHRPAPCGPVIGFVVGPNFLFSSLGSVCVCVCVCARSHMGTLRTQKSKPKRSKRHLSNIPGGMLGSLWFSGLLRRLQLLAWGNCQSTLWAVALCSLCSKGKHSGVKPLPLPRLLLIWQMMCRLRTESRDFPGLEPTLGVFKDFTYLF